MDGRGLIECRSVADAGWQSSDTAMPIRASLLTGCWLKSCTGVLFVRGVQREFEDLLAVLIFSPVRWVLKGCLCWLSEKDDKSKCRLIFQFIANTSDTLDFDGCVFLEVVAQTCNVDIQAVEIEVVVVAPEFLQEG